MDKVRMKVGRIETLFARTMEIATIIGLVITIGAGILYFGGKHDMVDAHLAVQNWDKAAPEFWESTTGYKVSGYSWFVDHLTYVDGVTVLGIAFLALVPLLSVFVALPKAEKMYKVIFGLLIIEFIMAIIRPLI